MFNQISFFLADFATSCTCYVDKKNLNIKKALHCSRPFSA